MTKPCLSIVVLFQSVISLGICQAAEPLQLTHGTDESAGGGPAYVVTTPVATYFLEKEGGGLSSIVDRDGVDWLGFHNEAGSGWKGEYRGFPNAIHRQQPLHDGAGFWPAGKEQVS